VFAKALTMFARLLFPPLKSNVVYVLYSSISSIAITAPLPYALATLETLFILFSFAIVIQGVGNESI